MTGIGGADRYYTGFYDELPGVSVDRTKLENNDIGKAGMGKELFYELDGDVLFLGTSHATNTSLHLAEYRADLDLATETHAGAALVDGEREWVQWKEIDYDDGDFPACGEAFESENPDAFETSTVGVGDAKIVSQPPLVDFAVGWFEASRE